MPDRFTYRPATAADIVQFYSRPLPFTVRAWVAEADGRVLGLAGYIPQGRYVLAFSEIKDEMRAHPMAVMRGAKKFMGLLDRPAVAYASRKEPGSCRLLERLGWKYATTDDQGEVFTWAIL